MNIKIKVSSLQYVLLFVYLFLIGLIFNLLHGKFIVSDGYDRYVIDFFKFFAGSGLEVNAPYPNRILYPFLVASISYLLSIDFWFTGLAISYLSFLGTCLIIYKLISQQVDDQIKYFIYLCVLLIPPTYAIFSLKFSTDFLFIFLLSLLYYYDRYLEENTSEQPRKKIKSHLQKLLIFILLVLTREIGVIFIFILFKHHIIKYIEYLYNLRFFIIYTFGILLLFLFIGFSTDIFVGSYTFANYFNDFLQTGNTHYILLGFSAFGRLYFSFEFLYNLFFNTLMNGLLLLIYLIFYKNSNNDISDNDKFYIIIIILYLISVTIIIGVHANERYYMPFLLLNQILIVKGNQNTHHLTLIIVSYIILTSLRYLISILSTNF